MILLLGKRSRAQASFREYNNASIERGLEWAKRAVAIAPDYGPAVAQLADSLASVYANGLGEDLELKERVRTLAMRAITLGTDDPVVLMRAGWSLCFVGYPDEGIRYTETAVSLAPGSGNTHHYHGMANLVCNRFDDALSQFATAERLMPGGHINWTMKLMAALINMSRDRWVEAETNIERCCVLIPGFSFAHVIKAVICLRQGREVEAHQHIRHARALGAQLASTLWFNKTLSARHSGYDRRVSEIRQLWTETDDAP